MSEVISAVLLIVGSLFTGLAGLGILRMPDLFIRISATTKASTLGVGFLLLAVAVKFGSIEIVSRAVAIIIFVLLSAPVAAHMIGRSAYLSGVELWKDSIVDDLCEHYSRCSKNPELFSDSTPQVAESLEKTDPKA